MTTDFVDRIYEASFVPELWPNILLDIAKVANSKGGLLLSTRDKSLNWTASDNIREAFADYLEGGWFRRCGRRICLLEKAHASFLREEDYGLKMKSRKTIFIRSSFIRAILAGQRVRASSCPPGTISYSALNAPARTDLLKRNMSMC